MQRTVLIALALTAPSAGGCATARSVQEADPKPFGGVTMSATDYFGGNGGGGHGGWAASFFWPLWLLDKPFSFAADVVTLPYVLWKRDLESCRPQRGVGEDPPPNTARSPERLPPYTGPMAQLRSEGVEPLPTIPSAGTPLLQMVGTPVARAAQIAREHGHSFAVVGTVDAPPPAVAYTGRWVEARTKDGIVASHAPPDQ